MEFQNVDLTMIVRFFYNLPKWTVKKIDSPSGRQEYSIRLGTIEPVFGNITINKGMN